jgi:hypothetical protein
MLKALFVILLLATPAAHGAPPVLPGLTWLAGDWQGEGDLADMREHYSAEAGGTLLGTNREVRDGKTTGVEFMYFEEKDGKVTLTEWFPGRFTLHFALVTHDADAWAFETRDTGVLDRLTYRRLDDRHMRIDLIKDVDGKAKVIHFPMHRTSAGR